MLARTLYALLCALLCSCQSGVVIQVRVSGRPADASTLIVSAFLDDTMAVGGARTLNRPADRFAVELQDVQSGKLLLHLSAQEASGCENATGDGTVLLRGPGTYPLDIVLSPQQGCTLEVELVGPVGGTVTSAPTGIACGSDCRYTFGRNAVVVLQQDTAARFGGWFTDPSQTNCTGRGSCAITNASGITKVRANFINDSSCVQSAWCIEEGLSASGGPANLYAIWGSSRDDVWAVGDSGTILHGDGIRFQQVPLDSGISWRGISGSGPSDVYAVGTGGSVFHYDGTGWTPIPVDTGSSWLNAVWVGSRDAVFIVGDNGTILRGNSSGFTTMASGTSRSLRGVWGSGPLDVWAVGDNGTVLHFRGALWERIEPLPPDNSLYGVWGSSADDVWMVGGGGLVLHYAGRFPLEEQRLGSGRALHAIFSASAAQTWAVGDNGAIWQRSGKAWSPVVPLPSSTPLSGVWGGSAQDVWAVGQSLTIVRYRP